MKHENTRKKAKLNLCKIRTVPKNEILFSVKCANKEHLYLWKCNSMHS